MCKVFMVAGINDMNREKVWAFAKAIAKPMSKSNNDGLGYSAITSDGKIFGERWLTNSDAFKPANNIDEKLYETIGDVFLEMKKSSTLGETNSFGDVDPSKAVAITLHTRFATSPKGMKNTHPFVDGNTSLIHNGVIRNVQDFTLKISTCDSEAILEAYVEAKVMDDVELFHKAAARLKGYYACGVLTVGPKGPIMDIFKSFQARLHCAYVEELNTWVISTDDSDIKDTVKEFGFTSSAIMTIKSEQFIRIDAITNKTLSLTAFKTAPEWEPYKAHSSYKASTDITYNNPPVVYPFDKKRETKISPDMLKYFQAGKQTCTRLTEREMQEEIMQQHRFHGMN